MEVKIEQERLSIHEASHAVVAKLFEDYLHLKYMTIDQQKSNDATESGSTNYGAIGVELRNFFAPSVAAVSLAGLVGEKIKEVGREKVCSSKAAILTDPNQIDRLLGGGDFALYKQNTITFDHMYGGPKEYQDICLNFLLDLLCDEKVWQVVELLSHEIMRKDDLTLSEQELDSLFQSSGYAEYVRNNKEGLLKIFEPRTDRDSIESRLKEMIIPGNFDIFS